ncbi:hypothetical protein QZH41_018117, partial [Actinostola sp. cb2023]
NITSGDEDGIMSVIGQIKEFDKAKEIFESYVERLENFMIANAVKKEQKVAVLLTAVGPETYGLLRNLVTPDKPDSKEYKELVQILTEHLNPKPLVIAERFNFNNRLKKETIQRKRLSEQDLEFHRGLQIAQSMEMAEKKTIRGAKGHWTVRMVIDSYRSSS